MHLLKPACIAFTMSILLGCSVTQTKVQGPPIQRATEVKLGVMERLQKVRPHIRKNFYITVGSFHDKTGQFKDATMLRYSRAVTQGGVDVLYYILHEAFGPKVVLERDGENMRRIFDEYQKSHIYDKKTGKQIGLIQRGGPDGGLTGALYMVTGSVVYYHVDRYTGGGGVNIDGVGVNFQTAIARVGVSLRLVNMSTSEVYWTTLMESWVSGTRIGVDIFRFITSGGDEYLVQGEAGIAYQLPADYALQDALASAVIDMVEKNKDIFLEEEGKDKLIEDIKKEKQLFLEKLKRHEKRP